jgi:hypothetical protein
VVWRKWCFDPKQPKDINREIKAEQKERYDGSKMNWCRTLTDRKSMRSNKLRHFDLLYINSDFIVVSLRNNRTIDSARRQQWHMLSM